MHARAHAQPIALVRSHSHIETEGCITPPHVSTEGTIVKHQRSYTVLRFQPGKSAFIVSRVEASALPPAPHKHGPAQTYVLLPVDSSHQGTLFLYIGALACLQHCVPPTRPPRRSNQLV